MSEEVKPDEKHRYNLKVFDGPLDLLLFLIRKNEINIYDIPIADITKQYLDTMEFSTAVNLEDITEFYLMSATLLYIKSRMLLPIEVDLEEEIEDPRQELVQRLIEYERIRKLAHLMAEREVQTEWTIERKNAQTKLPFPDEENLWEAVGPWELLKSFSKVMKSLGSDRIISLWEEVSINEKITLIREYLDDRANFAFDDLIINPGMAVEVVSAFLAMLELIKIGLIEVFQNRLFGDITISRSMRSGNTES